MIAVQQKGPNLGLDPVAVSPDGQHVVYSRGFRSGMCHYDVAPGMRGPNGELSVVSGLPTMETDGLSVFTRSVEWLDDNTYLIAGHVAPVNCKDSALPTFNTLYRCTVAAGCRDTSIPAARHARSHLGPTAQLVADAPIDDRGTLRIEWNGRQFTRDGVSVWAPIAWSR